MGNTCFVLTFNNLDENKGYLIFRGTDTKQGFLAREFNIRDSINSHVGILIHNQGWLIYNVSDFDKHKSALQSQTIEEFQVCEGGVVTDISIWDIKTEMNIKTNMLYEIQEVMKTKVIFDKFFDLNNKNLYCSEFVVNILEKADTTFSLKPIKRRLNGIYKSYFRKDSLEYYPVDIFQSNDHFYKINEWKITPRADLKSVQLK